MKNLKLSLVVLAIIAVAATATWAQVPATAQSNETTGHVGRRGCTYCHTPHGKNVTLLATASNTGLTLTTNPTMAVDIDPAATLPGTGIALAKVGKPAGSNVFLWANPLSPVTYQTWDGGTISTAGLTTADAAAHTLMCMTCHDTSNNTHDFGGTLGGIANNAQGQPAYTPNHLNGIGNTFWVGPAGSQTGGWEATGTAGWGTGTLTSSHPVHRPYPSNNKYWAVTVSGNAVTFTDAAFDLGDGNTGHPAKLYAQGGVAYIECTSCHDPHRETEYAYKAAGTWRFGETENYLRGPFVAGDGALQANFCRSCHYDKTQAFINAAGAAQ
jgi:hypothetical protein